MTDERELQSKIAARDAEISYYRDLLERRKRGESTEQGGEDELRPSPGEEGRRRAREDSGGGPGEAPPYGFDDLESTAEMGEEDVRRENEAGGEGDETRKPEGVYEELEELPGGGWKLVRRKG